MVTSSGNMYVMGGNVSVSADTLTADIIVELDVQKVEDILTNELIEFNIPVAPGSKTTTPPSAQIIDLKSIKNTVAIQGKLGTDSNEDAWTKKRKLFALAGYGGNANHSLMSGQTVRSGAVTIVWGLNSQGTQERIDGNIQQISITEVPGLLHAGDSTTEDTFRAFSVQLKIAVGSERG